jgi:hypothetical protein
MWRRIGHLALTTVIAFAVGPEHLRAQTQTGSPQSVESPFVTANRVLRASLERIARGSALWREAADAVRKTGRHALLVTPADPILSTLAKADRNPFDTGVLAEAVPLMREDAQIPIVVVIVNLPLLKGLHDARLTVPRHFEADVDRILVHEIYGHGVPYLLAGNVSGRCADPAPREPPDKACAIRRENAVRAELGLGRRGDAGLSSLTFAWGRLLSRE